MFIFDFESSEEYISFIIVFFPVISFKRNKSTQINNSYIDG